MFLQWQQAFNVMMLPEALHALNMWVELAGTHLAQFDLAQSLMTIGS